MVEVDRSKRWRGPQILITDCLDTITYFYVTYISKVFRDYFKWTLRTACISKKVRWVGRGLTLNPPDPTPDPVF